MYGISTEDMDSLTFGTPRLIRHLMAPASQKLDAMEFDHAKVGQRYMCSYWALARRTAAQLERAQHAGVLSSACGSLTLHTSACKQMLSVHHCPLAQVLEELGLSQEEFIDVCILCGCDYTPKISGIGAAVAGQAWWEPVAVGVACAMEGCRADGTAFSPCGGAQLIGSLDLPAHACPALRALCRAHARAGAHQEARQH